MKPSRFTRALYVLILSLYFFQIGEAQILPTIDSVTCICTGQNFPFGANPMAVEDSIIINATPGQKWWLQSYVTMSSPNNLLYHNTSATGFLLSGVNRSLDTLVEASSGRYVLRFFRVSSSAFTNLAFSNGSSNINTSLPSCTPPGNSEGITGLDTLCLGDSDTYNLVGITDGGLATAQWNLTDPNGIMNVLSGSGSSQNIPFTKAGKYHLVVNGETTKGCEFTVRDSMFVIDTDFDIWGPEYACAGGDTTMYTITPDLPSRYNNIVWSVYPNTMATFIGASTNTDTIRIAWAGSGSPYSRYVTFSATENSSAGCVATDSILVTVANTLRASIDGATEYCLNEMGMFTAFVNNVDTLRWRVSSPKNTIVGSATTSSLKVNFNEAGLDTIYLTGVTRMGCPIRDSIIVDVKDTGVRLSGKQGVCLGEMETYAALYSDGSPATFSSITWRITPFGADMDTLRIKSNPNGPFDSLKVNWNNVGAFDIIVNGTTTLGCVLSDTIRINVQDTSFLLLGPDLVCFDSGTDPHESLFSVVQAFDSTDVIGNDSVRWKVSYTSNNINFIKEELGADSIGGSTLTHGFSLGTYQVAEAKYLVMASGTSSYGCQFIVMKEVEVLGPDELKIEGPDCLCDGKTDVSYVVNLPDSLFSAGPNWTVQFADGTPYSTQGEFWTVDGDSLHINLPDIENADTLIISVTGDLKGSDCSPFITKMLILKDTIHFDPIQIDTFCLDTDSVFLGLNLDTSEVSGNITFALYKNPGNVYQRDLTVGNSNGKLGAYVTWPSAGDFIVRAQGYTDEDCQINETFRATVKDTNYIIKGDNQICIGDTITYVFLQGWNNQPAASTMSTANLMWSFSGADPSFIQYSGPIDDTIRVVFSTEGPQTITASGITSCDCEVDGALNILVRNTEFGISGPVNVCDDTQSLYYILNSDDSRIDDLVSDSTRWRLSSGMSAQFSGSLKADSIFINWNRTGHFANIKDTLYYSGVTNDGCIVRDTLPLVIHTNDYTLLGSSGVCRGTPVNIILKNAFDSSEVFGITQLKWVINNTDTIITPSLDTLDRLNMAGTMNIWPLGGVYNIKSIGMTSTGCPINENFTITVYDVPNVSILGDMNTCLGNSATAANPDVYSLNVPDSIINSVMWTITPLGVHATPGNPPFTLPTSSGAKTTELLISQWHDSGYADPTKADFRITVMGISRGGCAFSDTINVIINSAADAFEMVCNNSLNITLPNSCELELTPDMVLEDWESYTIPADEFEIRIKDPETGRMLSNSGKVDPSMIGKQVIIEVEHECSGQICWGYVRLEDKNIPPLLCGRDTIDCDDNYLPQFLNFGPNRITGYPVLKEVGTTVTPTSKANEFIVRGFEKCGDAVLTYNDRIQKEICDGTFGTIVYRDWKMTNLSGRMSTCTDTILIKRLDIDTFINAFKITLQDKTFECGQTGTGFANPNFDLDPFCFNIQWTATTTRQLLCNSNAKTYTDTKTWTFLDWCNGKVRTVSQKITFSDKTPPRITLRSGNIITRANDHHCFGDIVLTTNDININDANSCSDIATVRVRIYENDVTGALIVDRTYNGNFTSLTINDPNILLDLTKIFISVEATDACGNIQTASITRMIVVTDDVMPNAVCDDIVTLNLNDEGWGYASWQAFDRGSNDNCGPVDICVTRMDDIVIFEKLDADKDNRVIYSQFQNALQDSGRTGSNYPTTQIGNITYLYKDSLCLKKIKFECIDAMRTAWDVDVMVQMTVTDKNGNESNCMSVVQVFDDGLIDTCVVVQDTVFLDCGEDYSRFIPFDGDKTVRFLTKCGTPIVPTYRIDTSGLNNCGLGKIIRSYTATGRDGSTKTYQHIIMVGDSTDIINPNNVAGFWPIDYTGEGCPGAAIHPDNLPVQYRPKFDAEDYPCSNADLNYVDLVFHNVEGYCAKVLRTWTLIDWCQMKSNDPTAGVWEHLQVLKLTDTADPVINANPTETRTTSSANSCSAFVSLTVSADDCHESKDLIWSYVISQGPTVISAGTSNSINRQLTVGTYFINWIVKDPCGNSDTLEQRLNVLDGVAPSLSCQNRSVAIGSTGSVVVVAADFAGNSTDACTSPSNIKYTFGSISGPTSRTYTCTDLAQTPQRTLTIVAVDESGNVSECSVTLTLTATAQSCPNQTLTATIAGAIKTANNLTIDKVKVQLKNAGDVTMSDAVTPLQGSFSFKDIPMYNKYIVSASRDDDYLNGVTTLDLLLIQRHLLGLSPLNSPYKVIAADVDGSFSVSGADLVSIRKLILGTAVDLPVKRSWTFVDASQTFELSYKPFPYRQSLQITDLASNLSNLNFVGVKMGDVNENVYLESGKLAGTRSITNLNVTATDLEDNKMLLSFDANASMIIAGMQVELIINPDYAEVLKVSSAVFDMQNEYYSLSKEGALRMSYASEQSVSIESGQKGLIQLIISKKNGDVSIDNIIQLNTMGIASEIYTAIGEEIEVSEIGLQYAKTTDHELGLELSQNKPNPFKGSTQVKFFNPSNSEVTLSIFDMAGKQVMRQRAHYEKGWHEVTIRADQLEGGGVYIYEVNNGSAVIRKKMMSID